VIDTSYPGMFEFTTAKWTSNKVSLLKLASHHYVKKRQCYSGFKNIHLAYVLLTTLFVYLLFWF